MRIGFVGAGRTGTALAVALSAAGYDIAAVASQSETSAHALARRIPGATQLDAQGVVAVSDLIFLTVPDDAVAPLAASLSWPAGTSVVHCSGAYGPELLAAAQQGGAAPGAFHPLQTFADRDSSPALDGCTFAIEAGGPLLTTLSDMARELGGRPLQLQAGQRALYHASASMASNYLVTLLASAAGLWTNFGTTPEDALTALLPLVKSTLENVERLGPQRALTGPIARGDSGTIGRHLAALAAEAPAMMGVYREMGLSTIPIALEKATLTPTAAQTIERLLDQTSPGNGR